MMLQSISRFAVGAVGRVVSSPTSIRGCTVGTWRSQHVESTDGPRPAGPQCPGTRCVKKWQRHNRSPPFELDPLEFLLCLRTARGGAAPGPSGMTSDHIFPLLESDHDSDEGRERVRTSFPGTRCCRVSEEWKMGTRSSPLCDAFTGARPLTSGKTNWARQRTPHKGRGGTR